MRFIIDAQLPPALARWLSSHGHHAEHVADLFMADASDLKIWQHASMVSAVIVTKDQDFPGRRAIEQDGPQIVWLRCGNTRRRELLAWFEVRFTVILAALERGENLVEIA